MIWFIWTMICSSAALALFMAWCVVEAWREGGPRDAAEWIVRLVLACAFNAMFWLQRSAQLVIDAGLP